MADSRFNIDSNVSEFVDDISRISPAAGQAMGALAAIRTTMRSLNAVIAANPIGALLTIVTTFVTYVASTYQPVIDRATAAFAALEAVWNVGIDTIGSLLGLTEASSLTLAEAAAAAYNLERATQALADRQIELLTVNARLRADISEYRAIAADATLTEQERIQALSDAQRVQDELFANEREVLQERVRILMEQQAISSNTREDNEELAMLQAELIGLDQRQNDANRELIGTRTGLERTIRMQAEATRALNEQKAIQQELDDIALRNTQLDQDLQLQVAQGILTEAEARSENIDRIYEELEATDNADIRKMLTAELDQRLFEDELARIEEGTQAYEDAQRRRQQAMDDEMEAAMVQQETEEAITDARIGLASQLGDTLQALAGENKALAITGLIVEQAAGVADIIVQTARANARAAAEFPLTAGQPFVTINTISAGLSIASAIGATAQGIQQINSSGGPAVSGVAGAGGSTSIPFGPQVSVPQADRSAPSPTAVANETSTPQVQVALTPSTGPGSLQSTIRKNNRNMRRSTFRPNRRSNASTT